MNQQDEQVAENSEETTGKAETADPSSGASFYQGEIVELKGSKFKVSNVISHRKLVLKLLPNQ